MVFSLVGQPVIIFQIRFSLVAIAPATTPVDVQPDRSYQGPSIIQCGCESGFA
jgi:hypothetical protein